MFEPNITPDGRCLCIKMSHSGDFNADKFRLDYQPMLSQQIEYIDVDLSSLDFIDSVMLGYLAMVYAAVTEDNPNPACLRLLNPSHEIRQILERVHFGELFEIISIKQD